MLTPEGFLSGRKCDSVRRFGWSRHCIGAPLSIARTDLTSDELRGLCRNCADERQLRRLLALALIDPGRLFPRRCGGAQRDGSSNCGRLAELSPTSRIGRSFAGMRQGNQCLDRKGLHYGTGNYPPPCQGLRCLNPWRDGSW